MHEHGVGVRPRVWNQDHWGLEMRRGMGSPLEAVVGSRGERGALEDLADLLSAVAEVVDGPHVGELDHAEVGVAPRLCDRGRIPYHTGAV